MTELRTLLWLRYRLLVNSTRTIPQIMEKLAKILMYCAIAALSVMCAVVFGFLAYHWVLDPQPHPLHIMLLGLFVFWQICPQLAKLTDGVDLFDLRRYLILPIAPERIATCNSRLTFSEPMVLFFVPGFLAFTIGGLIASTGAGLLIGLTALTFLACNATLLHLSRTARHALQGRGRLLQACMFVGILVPSIAAAYGLSYGNSPNWIPRAAVLTLPSGWAAAGLASVVITGRVHWWLLSIAAMWLLAAGAERLDVRWSVEHAVLARDSGPSGVNREGSGIPGRLRNAVIGKELTYLLRSNLARDGLLLSMLPLPYAIFRLLAKDLPALRPVHGLTGLALLFLFFLAIFDRYSRNHWGWDGAGVRAYFLAPVTPQQVIRGKIMAALILFAGLAALSLLLYLRLVYLPAPLDLAFIVGTATAALIFHLAEGSLTSLWFARSDDMTRSDKQTRGSVLASLLRGLIRTPFYLLLGGSAFLYFSTGPIGFLGLGIAMLAAIGLTAWLPIVVAGLLRWKPEKVIDVVCKKPD